MAGALILGVGAGYFGRAAVTPDVALASNITYRPVTFEEGFVFAGRFAPDGRTIVYSADWDRQQRGVYVTSLDSLEYRLLGFPGSDLLGVSKSGDLAVLNGSAITGGNGYWRLGSLAKGSLTGGSSRAKLDGVRFADFGSDGTMAVVREKGWQSTAEYPVGQVLAEASGVGFRGAFASPRVSSSGEYVAFFDTHVPSADTVKVFNRSGKLVAESRPFHDWWALAWNPNNEIWFAASETAGSQVGIFSLDLAGKDRVVWRAPGAVTLHDISPQGDVLVSFDRGSVRTELLQGAGATPVDRSWREAGALGAHSNNHIILINGLGDSGGPLGSVYAWMPGAQQPVRIADGQGLALSPDGTKALVTTREAPIKISIVPTGAGQVETLDLGLLDFMTWAGWLPDGRLIVNAGRKGEEPAVQMMTKPGSPLEKFLPAGIVLRGVAQNLISPDGSQMAALDQQSRQMLCTIAKPSTCRPTPGVRDNDVMAGWTADGKAVIVYHREPAGTEVDRVDITTGNRTMVTMIKPLQAALSGINTVIAAPDGTLAYGYSHDASQLYVIKGLK